ncbi:MAG: adenosylmethionine--8-amino-7-oxononanoate transaminase [Legionella sp.]
MVNTEQFITRDLNHVWHPCMQMKDFESIPPLFINKAYGSYIDSNEGVLIDAISSWWCKSLGHGHPAVNSAIKQQLARFEHVISANTTHPSLVELAEKLAQITGNQHIFFASDGSSAVEIAMKLAIHANVICGFHEKNQFIALKNGYHGETMGAMSVSDLGIYKKPYESFGVICHFIDAPYVSGTTDPLWSDCSEHWRNILPVLEQVKQYSCALILEPIIQGAGGMLCYSADFLKKLAAWAKENNIYLIADEIMTGIGRTGSWLASDHAGIKADLICLSKGLTSGSLPLSCVMLSHEIYELFYDDYDKGKSFLHSHTYSGNPLAINAALATIKTIDEEQIIPQAAQLGELMRRYFTDVAALSGVLNNVRGIGAVMAADLTLVANKRIGHEIYQQALKHGALLRPIGNTLYWLPPLNTSNETIGNLAEITLNSIKAAYLNI